MYSRLISLYSFDLSYSALGVSSPLCVAGVDEAGRGSLAGPVVASAVVLDLNVLIPFLNDSKKLGVSRRNTIFEQIKETALGIGIGIVGPEIIDDINILNATKRAMHEALTDLLPEPHVVLLDAVCLSGLSQRAHSIVKGDAKSASIAAASIVAKCTRDRLMESYDVVFPNYSFAKHKGYPTKEHIRQLKEHGPVSIHRKTYAPVRVHL